MEAMIWYIFHVDLQLIPMLIWHRRPPQVRCMGFCRSSVATNKDVSEARGILDSVDVGPEAEIPPCRCSSSGISRLAHSLLCRRVAVSRCVE